MARRDAEHAEADGGGYAVLRIRAVASGDCRGTACRAPTITQRLSVRRGPRRRAWERRSTPDAQDEADSCPGNVVETRKLASLRAYPCHDERRCVVDVSGRDTWASCPSLNGPQRNPHGAEVAAVRFACAFVVSQVRQMLPEATVLLQHAQRHGIISASKNVTYAFGTRFPAAR